MKIALHALSLFLLAFSSSAFVVDTDGDPMLNGGKYYILPVGGLGRPGGVGVDKTGNETFPISVIQYPRYTENDGLPVRIASPYKILYIYEGLPLTLAFTKVPKCVIKHLQWAVVEGLPEGRSLKLSGFYHNELTGWFTIERNNDDYKLTFCPENGATCGDVGVIDKNGVRQLVVGNENAEIMLVKFKKATEHSAIKLPTDI